MTSAEIAITVTPIIAIVLSYSYLLNERRKVLDARRKRRDQRALTLAE